MSTSDQELEPEYEMTPEMLARAAEWFSRHDLFCGYWLFKHDRMELLSRLGCDEETFHGLCLCFAPSADQWDEHLTHLHEHTGIPVEALAWALNAFRDPFREEPQR